MTKQKYLLHYVFVELYHLEIHADMLVFRKQTSTRNKIKPLFLLKQKSKSGNSHISCLYLSHLKYCRHDR